MAEKQNIKFIDSTAVGKAGWKYVSVKVRAPDVLKSWKDSLFSFEWLDAEGRIKPFEKLPAAEKPRRKEVEDKIRTHQPLEKPVLGIGLQDNIEIGSGRAVFLTLAALGYDTVEVHIPKSNESDFKAFRADVSS